MEQKDLTKTFMMTSNLKNPFDFHGLHKYISALYLYVTWQYALLRYRAMGAIAPHCGFSGVSSDGNCSYVH